jgi:hypothetical protein
MPLDPSIQAEIDAYLAEKITKVRIPELPGYSTYGTLSLLDRIPLWMNSVNKTVWVDSLSYKALLTTGSIDPIVPSFTGNSIIVEATGAEVGVDTILRSELEGKMYTLRVEGKGILKPGTEWQLLSGGFKLLNPGSADPYSLYEGQRFEAELYNLVQSSTGSPAPLSSSFITGKIEASTNTTLNGVNHANKLISLRGGNSTINIILPDIALVPEKAVFFFEAQINNDFQTGIFTTGGQSIYMNHTSWSNLYIAKGETLWLFRDDSGWIVINDFGNNYRNLGKPYAAYSVEDDENELLCDGRNLTKVDYPRLWNKVQTIGAALTTNPTTWDTNKGMWLEVDSATFRVPDLRKMILKGLDAGETGGRFQENQVGEYTDTQGDHGTTNTVDTYTNGPFHFKTKVINPGAETLVDNIGIMWVVKY